MSKIVDTDFGQFRHCNDGSQHGCWLHLCPSCGEQLPMADVPNNPMVHESLIFRDSYCDYRPESQDLGLKMVAHMQAMRLMGYQPFHDEGQRGWVPSKSGGVDGVIG